MKRFILASALAAGVVLGLAPGADAKVSVGVFFGVPHYDYRVGPDYVYRDGYGWYRRGPSYGYGYDRISCGEAKMRVRNSGFRHVSTVECNGRTYTFEGITRRGRPATIYVNSRSGAVWRG